jgi:uncharacterized protein YciI
MFVVLLRLSNNKSLASQFMNEHNSWIEHGFDDGVFLLVGNLQQGGGGAILAHNTSLESLQERLQSDPFVTENVVESEILEITPNRTDRRLCFLAGHSQSTAGEK